MGRHISKLDFINQNTTASPDNKLINAQNFENEDFQGYKFNKIQLTNCEFKNCIFNNATFSSFKANKCTFVDCEFKNVHILNEVGFVSSKFLVCIFDESKITNASLNSNTFEKCTFKNSFFENIYFSSTSFLNSNFSGFSLRLCNLIDTKWEGVKINPKTSFEYCVFNPHNSSVKHDVLNDKSDKICFLWPHKFWNWKLISKIGRLPTLEFSWSVFAIGLFFLSTILFINDSRFIVEGIRYPIPIPQQLIWLTLGSFCASLGTFFYRAGCPERIQNFTENEWVEEHGHPRVFYREQCVKNIKLLYATTIFLALGIVILSYLIICRISYVIVHLLL